MGRYKEIRDDEIRIINASQEKKGFRLWVWVCLATSGVAIILALVFIVLRLIKKQNLKMYLPVFFFVIGLIVYVVASNIPCSTGG